MPITTSTRTRAGALAALAVLLVGATSACGSSDSSTTATSPPSSDTSSTPTSPASSDSGQPDMAGMIMIKNFSFDTPKSVKAGSTVEVMNMDSEAHTVTADSGGAFDVTIQPGKTATFKAPSKPGSYPYHCTYHSNMHGTLTVR